MIRYYSDRLRRGAIKIINKYDCYVWDYSSQRWLPYPPAGAARYDRVNFDEISVSETEKIMGLWS